MNTYLSSADLKYQAKEKLAGHYGIVIGGSIVISMITNTLTSWSTLLLPANSPITLLITMAVSFVVSVFAGVLNVGLMLIFMKLSFGTTPYLSDLFYGFSHVQTALGISLVISLVSLPLSMSYTIPMVVYSQTQNDFCLYLMFLCVAAALVVYMPLSLALSQCYFLMLDYPDKTAGEIIRLSCHITKGHRLRLFYIQVTFLPLLLLGYLSLVGVLWVNAYIYMTMTQFYFDIMKPVQKN